MSEISDITEISEGLRGYILSQKPRESQVHREFWTLNDCTYEAYRKYTRHVKEFGFPDHQKQEEKQRQVQNVNSSHHSISSDTSMLMRTVSWRSQAPLFTFKGMRAVIDDCKSPITVLKFGRLSSSLLAWGSQEGDVFFADLEKEKNQDLFHGAGFDKGFVPNEGMNSTIKKLRNNIIGNVLDNVTKKGAQTTIDEHEEEEDDDGDELEDINITNYATQVVQASNAELNVQNNIVSDMNKNNCAEQVVQTKTAKLKQLNNADNNDCRNQVVETSIANFDSSHGNLEYGDRTQDINDNNQQQQGSESTIIQCKQHFVQEQDSNNYIKNLDEQSSSQTCTQNLEKEVDIVQFAEQFGEITLTKNGIREVNGHYFQDSTSSVVGNSDISYTCTNIDQQQQKNNSCSVDFSFDSCNDHSISSNNPFFKSTLMTVNKNSMYNNNDDSNSNNNRFRLKYVTDTVVNHEIDYNIKSNQLDLSNQITTKANTENGDIVDNNLFRSSLQNLNSQKESCSGDNNVNTSNPFEFGQQNNNNEIDSNNNPFELEQQNKSNEIDSNTSNNNSFEFGYQNKNNESDSYNIPFELEQQNKSNEIDSNISNNNPFEFGQQNKNNEIDSNIGNNNLFEFEQQKSENENNEIDESSSSINNPFKLLDQNTKNSKRNGFNTSNYFESSNQPFQNGFKHNNSDNFNSDNNNVNINTLVQSSQISSNEHKLNSCTQARPPKKVDLYSKQWNDRLINSSKSAPIKGTQENEKRMNINLDINRLNQHNKKNNTVPQTSSVVQLPQTFQFPKQHQKCVMDLDWSQDNQFILTASLDSKLCLWDLNSKKCIRIITSKIQLFCCRFHQMNQNILLCGGSGGTIEAYNSSTGTLVQKADVRLYYNIHENINITSMACSNTCMYIGDSTGDLYMLQCEIRNGKLWPLMFISRTPYPKYKASEIVRILYQGYSAFVHGPSLLCSVLDGSVFVYRVYDTIGKLELVQQVCLPAMARRIFTSWCPTPTLEDPEFVVTGGEDTCVTIYDIKNHHNVGNQITEVNKLQGHSSPVVDVCWSYDEESLASGDCNGMVIVWKRQQQESGLSSRRISQGSWA